ncbi:MAG: hypothetical protein ABIQ95_12305 [Bdellovibrionia bacterium]
MVRPNNSFVGSMGSNPSGVALLAALLFISGIFNEANSSAQEGAFSSNKPSRKALIKESEKEHKQIEKDLIHLMQHALPDAIADHDRFKNSLEHSMKKVEKTKLLNEKKPSQKYKETIAKHTQRINYIVKTLPSAEVQLQGARRKCEELAARTHQNATNFAVLGKANRTIKNHEEIKALINKKSGLISSVAALGATSPKHGTFSQSEIDRMNHELSVCRDRFEAAHLSFKREMRK